MSNLTIFIIGFVLLGSAMEARAKRQTTNALREMARLQPTFARVRRNGASAREQRCYTRRGSAGVRHR